MLNADSQVEYFLRQTLVAVLGTTDGASHPHLTPIWYTWEPHYSVDECRTLARLCKGRTFTKPVYVCTRFDVYAELTKSGERKIIEETGATFVIGTCVVATPILKSKSGVLMTNSGKFAHYSPSLIGHEVVFGSLSECVESAVAGRVVRDPEAWGAL